MGCRIVRRLACRPAAQPTFSVILPPRFVAAGNVPSHNGAFLSQRRVPCQALPVLSRRCMRDIAIVGGGPAGAMCGERLARSGYNVTIYDEHLAWEKPCGGGLTHKAIQAYPFLLYGPFATKINRTVGLISS